LFDVIKIRLLTHYYSVYDPKGFIFEKNSHKTKNFKKVPRPSFYGKMLQSETADSLLQI